MKPKRLLKFLIIILSFILTLPSYAQIIAYENLSHYYNPYAPVHLSSSLHKDGEALKVKIFLSSTWKVKLENSFSLSYSLSSYHGYSGLSQEVMIPINHDNTNGKDGNYNYEVLLPFSDHKKVMILFLTTLDNRAKYMFDINLRDFTVKNDVTLSSSQKQSLISISELDNQNKFLLKEIDLDNETRTEAYKKFRRRKQKELESNFFDLSKKASTYKAKPGLYYAYQVGDGDLSGRFVKLVDEIYPAYDRLEPLVECLEYISSKEEYQEILNAENPKVAFDRFWLEHSRDEIKAKQAIKHFYTQVKWANHFFTTHQDGWKTDQGMVFVMFGRPNEVFRNKRKEYWLYHNERDKSKIKFTFVKKNGLTDRPEYRLKRKRRYKKNWRRSQDVWKIGVKAI